jgi:hypothetical protein
MRKLSVPLGLGLALSLLTAAAVLAAAPPPFLAAAPGEAAGSPALAALFGSAGTATSTPARILDADTSCGLPRYSCQACSPASTGQRLCSEQICGTYVIVHCNDCAAHCSLPPG